MESHTEPRDELVIVGPGRVGRSLVAEAASAGIQTVLIGRDDLAGGTAQARGPDASTGSCLSGRTVLLCVPDDAIAPAASRIGELTAGAPPSRIGHVSGATTLDALDPAGAPSRFSIHPLQTFPGPSTPLAGSPAAVSGSDEAAEGAARALAAALGMEPFRVAEEDRAVYHAAASIASNFLIALEETAAELLEGIAVAEPRRILAPLIGRTLANWTDTGAVALTGPIARGDEATIERHRAALAARRPDLSGLYEELAARTRAVASGAGFQTVSLGESEG